MIEPRVLLRFVNRVPPYNAGETAAFSMEKARDFLRIGAAVLANEPAPVVAASPPPEAIAKKRRPAKKTKGTG